MTLIIKLSLLPSIFQRSFQLSLWCFSFSQLVHWPSIGDGLVPHCSTCPKSKSCPVLLNVSNYISTLERRLCFLHSLWRSPHPCSGSSSSLEAQSASVFSKHLYLWELLFMQLLKMCGHRVQSKSFICLDVNDERWRKLVYRLITGLKQRPRAWK